jgi:hypothetical protein
MDNQIKIKKNRLILHEDEDEEYNSNSDDNYDNDNDKDSDYDYDKSEYKKNISSFYEFKSEPKSEAKSEPKSVEQKPKKKLISIKKVHLDDEEDDNKLINKNPCLNCEVNRELLNVIYELSNKLDNVENELKELKEIVKKKSICSENSIPPINKKNVVDWLNNYIVPTISFDDFVENLVVNMGHFEFLLEYKLPDTIQRIIQTNIIKDKNVIYPLYSTIEKSGKVYVFTEDETWDVINIDYLTKFVKQIENKLFQHSIEWKKNNNSKNNFNNELQERCQNAISKLCNISYTQDVMMNRVKHDMCVQLKTVCK